MEALSRLLDRAMEGGFLSGCSMVGKGGVGVKVSRLLYADDTLIFFKASKDQLTHLCWVLMWFEALSRLRNNLDKSELLPIGNIPNADDLADELGCKVSNLPSTYLGLPFGASYKLVIVWDGVEERFKKRLAMWKRQYISKGGRATLIKSTLSSLPIYFVYFSSSKIS